MNDDPRAEAAELAKDEDDEAAFLLDALAAAIVRARAERA